ncbi:MAG: saccharopine dehydrogenase NADP-binding domain-containing protein, partial [Limnobacter sp.]|nr:saccharopine dehydrogenase NADP-binding domain-containing protein [Limnobacter sp.]
MTAKYDVVIFGATSFVGQILAEYYWKRHGLNGEISWAIAGRSESKLKSLQSSLGAGAKDIPLIVADAQSPADLKKLCAQANVVCSTVGPYALYGNEVVKACAESGTHYCDLTGEVQWIDRMIQANEAAAQKSGAKIVHCCGFDSIPSDMGVYYVQQQAKAKLGKTCKKIRMRVRKAKGEFSGGTVASLVNVTKEVSANPGLAKKLGNPYLIAPSNPKT